MSLIDSINIRVREKLNPYLGKFRRSMGGVKSDFSIVSNNCWAGHVYRYFNLPYNTPTIGLYIYSEDYIKLLKDIKGYFSSELRFINIEDSKHKEDLLVNHPDSIGKPIGKLKDIEIVFLHYKSEKEAFDKWTRRCQRFNYDNFCVKMSEMNQCSEDLIKEFDGLPYERKFIFTTRDYGIASQVIFKEYSNSKEIANDTARFRKYINLEAWINGLPFKKNQ